MVFLTPNTSLPSGPTASIAPVTVQRLEAVEAASARRMVELTPGAAGLEAIGGFAAYMGAGSPLTHALGMGMNGTVTTEDLDRVQAFYDARECDAVLELCPLADASLLAVTQASGYRIVQFENLLVASLAAAPPEPGIKSIRRIGEDEHGSWAHLMARAFFSRDEVTAEEAAIGVSIARLGGSYIAEADGLPVATGAMWIHDEIAFLMCDGTLPGFRGRGLQQALIQRRLIDAMAAGARHAMASTLVNSGSQANYVRQGFRVVYTKLTAVRPREQ